VSRWKSSFRGRMRGLLLAGVATSLALAVLLQRDAIRTFDWRLSWPPFVAAVCLFAIGPLAGAVSFWIVLRNLAPGARLVPSVWVWERSFAARYIPSGALTLAVRLVERERLAASRAQMLSATAFEQLIAAAGAAAVSLAAWSVSGRRPPILAIVVLAAVLTMAGVARPAAVWWTRRRMLAGSVRDPLAIVGKTALAAALVLCVCGWLVAGAATWVFVTALTAGPAPAFLFLLGAYTFAWLVGFVVPFAPSGLGVREATMIALLAPVLGAAPATALTVGIRLANLAGDFLAIGLIEAVWLGLQRRRRGRGAHTSPCEVL
jgi:uncharacterized membrane protein YbhN (UPF0104 family)